MENDNSSDHQGTTTISAVGSLSQANQILISGAILEDRANKNNQRQTSLGQAVQQFRLLSLLLDNALTVMPREATRKPLEHTSGVWNSSGLIRLSTGQLEAAKTYAVGVTEQGTNWNYSQSHQEKLALCGTCGEMAVHTFATKVLGMKTISGPDTKIYSSNNKSHSPDLVLALKTEESPAKISLLPCHIKTFRLWDTNGQPDNTPGYNFTRAEKYEPAWLFHAQSIAKYSSPEVNVSTIARKMKLNQDSFTVLPGMVFLVIQITPEINYIAHFDWFYNIQELLTEFQSFNAEHQNKHSRVTRRLGMSDILLGYPSVSSDGGISFIPWWNSNLFSQLSNRLGLLNPQTT